MTYLENLHKEMRLANRLALKMRDGKAWDNAKVKTRKRMAPRGPFFKRLEKAERTRVGNKLIADTKSLLAESKKLHDNAKGE